MKRALPFLFLAVLPFPLTPTQAQMRLSAVGGTCIWPEQKNMTPANLNFADGLVGTTPNGWMPQRSQAVSYGAHKVSASECDGSQQCAAVTSKNPQGIQFLYQDLNVVEHRGQTLTFRAHVRVDPSQQGVGRLLVRLHRRDCSTAFRDDMGAHPITSGKWAVYQIHAPIPTDAYHMEFGLQVLGQGEAWIDQISMKYCSPSPKWYQRLLRTACVSMKSNGV